MGSVILASNATTYIAPAMNTNMWLDKSTQENFQTLVSRGMSFHWSRCG
jgi:phosphopantothenoylcysteine synthetase/decarboxylase